MIPIDIEKTEQLPRNQSYQYNIQTNYIELNKFFLIF